MTSEIKIITLKGIMCNIIIVPYDSKVLFFMEFFDIQAQLYRVLIPHKILPIVQVLFDTYKDQECELLVTEYPTKTEPRYKWRGLRKLEESE